MAMTHAAMTTYISTYKLNVADTVMYGLLSSNIKGGIRELSTYVPYLRREVFQIESRRGTASTTSANNLVDTTESQFLATDTNKTVYNTTDNTWADIISFTSTGQVGLSKDIFAGGEAYAIYNKNCYSNKQINISDIKNWLTIDSVEYPIGTKRNWNINGDILEIEMDRQPDDSSVTGSEVDVYVTFQRPHFLTELTDLAGVVAATAAVAATSLAMSSLQAAGTIDIGQELTIANVRGTYIVTESSTIASNTATVTIYPGLESAIASTGVVVTLKQSTLNPQQEEVLADLVTARTLINYATEPIQQINTVITTIATATAAITASTTRYAAATTFIDSATTQIAAGTTAVATAETPLALMDEEVALAATSLAAATALVNTVTVGDSVAYNRANIARAYVNDALGYAQQMRGYLAKSNSDDANASGYRGLAITSAQLAEHKLNEAKAVFNEVKSRLTIANASNQFQIMGERKLAEVQRRIRALPRTGRRSYKVLSRA